MKVAENLRSYIEKYNFEKIGKLTASFGVSEYKAGDDEIALISRADEALYKAKELGRNRVSSI